MKLFTALEMALSTVSTDLLLTFFWLAFNNGLALRLQLVQFFS